MTIREARLIDYPMEDLGGYFNNTVLPYTDANGGVRLGLISHVDTDSRGNVVFNYYPNLRNGSGWSERLFKKKIEDFFYTSRWRSLLINYGGDARLVSVTGSRNRHKGLSGEQFSMSRPFREGSGSETIASAPEAYLDYVKAHMRGADTLNTVTITDAVNLIVAGDARSVALTQSVAFTCDTSGEHFKVSLYGTSCSGWKPLTRDDFYDIIGPVFARTVVW